MTNYETQVALGPVITSLAGKEKGDIVNRGKCATAQVKNSVQTSVADTVVLSGAAATTIAVSRSKNFAKMLLSPFKLIGKACKKFVPKDISGAIQDSLKSAAKYVKNNKFTGRIVKSATLKKVVEQLKNAGKVIGNNPKAAAALAILTGTAALLRRNHDRAYYQMGQIDQKYTDRANIDKIQCET